eukprot:gnl/MRDRNA2_/MRDRNA2_102284_c0_seq1.p1 gnl/MRDRNA2_/MRDRNA2_102284_c0~~gnl/MRDRNA2_/MRDRNA2_102284_c0_seq1.p1  ORF type:complete len:395 (-),score=62.45 gnl/MRDRNA2_/MRDRNA2_102284_c0_seq1:18-1037(-)
MTDEKSAEEDAFFWKLRACYFTANAVLAALWYVVKGKIEESEDEDDDASTLRGPWGSKIEVPDVYQFHVQLKAGDELTPREYDLSVWNEAFKTQIGSCVVCFLFHYYFSHWIILAAQICSCFFELRAGPLTSIYIHGNEAKGPLARPFQDDIVPMPVFGSVCGNWAADACLIGDKGPQGSEIFEGSIWDGEWFEEKTGERRGRIDYGKYLIFDNGTCQEVAIIESELRMQMQGARYTAKLLDGKITWSDGEVWRPRDQVFNGEWFYTAEWGGNRAGMIQGQSLEHAKGQGKIPITIEGSKKICIYFDGQLSEDGREITWNDGSKWERQNKVKDEASSSS